MLIFLMLMQISSLPTASEVVDRSIRYHDPQGVWAELEHTFSVRESRPDGSAKHLRITIDHPGSRFVYEGQIEDADVVRKLIGDRCEVSVDGEAMDSGTTETSDLSCDEVRRLRNYYDYLLGAPMKLRDPGTVIDDEVEWDFVDQKRALRVRVTYEDQVGSDVWYYYFDPASYRLLAMRFYHDEMARDGELIIMEDEIEVGSLMLPRHRHWYRNRDEMFLGTDTILD